VNAQELSDPDERIIVEFPATAGYRVVGRLVLGGLSARFELPVDRVEDLMLALDSLMNQELSTDVVTVEAVAAPGGLRARVGPFVRSQVEDAAVARVLNPLVDEVTEDGTQDGYWVELGVSAERTAGVGG
jgi:hypothetical protein